MHWYSGGIQEAVMASKAKGAVFVVYIEGSDEKSQIFTSLIDTKEISSQLGSDNFVAIKLEVDSVPHRQFSELYNPTTVPSLYFIGKNGKPVKIITEIIDTKSFLRELEEILQNSTQTSSAATSAQNLIKSESTMPPNVMCENGVCTIKSGPPSTGAGASTPPEGDAPKFSSEEKVERAKKLLEQKRLQKEAEEKEAEKLKEMERRKMGQEMQKMKKWQEDMEVKQAIEARDMERKREKEARDRVLAQIAQDKLDRAAKFAPVASSTPTQPTAGPSVSRPSRQDSNTARLQFKMADGSSKTQDFPSTDKLQSVVNYIKTNLNLPYSKFTLSTTFPRRQFKDADYEKTLADLELTPNSVILILPIGGGGPVSTNTLPGGISGFIWGLFAPLIQLFSAIKAWLLGEGAGGSSGGVSGGYSSGTGGAFGSQRRSSNSVVAVRSKYDLDNRIKSAGTKLIVIDFFATWCGPCKMIAPELEKMAKDFPNVIFLKVDVDQNGDISRDYGVQSMPTFVMVKNKREVTRFSGADSYELRNSIQRYK